MIEWARGGDGDSRYWLALVATGQGVGASSLWDLHTGPELLLVQSSLLTGAMPLGVGRWWLCIDSE